jgi:hypothetical protein
MSAKTKTTLPLRVPPDLKQRLSDYAANTGLSMNSAAIILLREALGMNSHGHGLSGTPTPNISGRVTGP